VPATAAGFAGAAVGAAGAAVIGTGGAAVAPPDAVAACPQAPSSSAARQYTKQVRRIGKKNCGIVSFLLVQIAVSYSDRSIRPDIPKFRAHAAKGIKGSALESSSVTGGILVGSWSKSDALRIERAGAPRCRL
jgi:hypothetical protein